MVELQVFYRLFLYTPEDSRFAFRVRVCPDIEQARGRDEPTGVISSSSLESLTLCLRELGVTGYSRWPDQVSDTVFALIAPKLEYHESSPEAIVASLTSHPLSRVAHVTLIAANTSASEMKRRIAGLRVKAPESLVIEEPASNTIG